MSKTNKNDPDLHHHDESIKNKAAISIARWINRLQRGFGNSLNKRTQHLNRNRKILLLLLVTIAFGGASIYVIVSGMYSNRDSASLLKHSNISVPKHIVDPDYLLLRDHPYITADDMANIRSFRIYMDSLMTTKTGEEIYDSILRRRPYLMDSLEQVELIYGIDSIKVSTESK